MAKLLEKYIVAIVENNKDDPGRILQFPSKKKDLLKAKSKTKLVHMLLKRCWELGMPTHKIAQSFGWSDKEVRDYAQRLGLSHRDI